MTSSPATWHDDITINGEPYPTRYPLDGDAATSNDCFDDLLDHHRQYLRAVHEAAHAVAGLTANAHIHYAKIARTAELATAAPTTIGIPGGDVFACNFPEGQTFAVFLGAGERAEDRWLRQNNLWTPRRAVGVELGACADRRTFLATNPHFGFGEDRNDYRVVHDLADQLVTDNWTAITAIADILATQLHLTGEQIATLAQMPNGAHSVTCNAPTP